jgi:TonB family protein
MDIYGSNDDYSRWQLFRPTWRRLGSDVSISSCLHEVELASSWRRVVSMSKSLLSHVSFLFIITSMSASQWPLMPTGDVTIPEVRYPWNSIATGVVSLLASVNSDGNVTETRIVNSILSLDESALQAIRRWKFPSFRVENGHREFPVSCAFIFGRSGAVPPIKVTRAEPPGAFLPPLPMVFACLDTHYSGDAFVVVQADIDKEGHVKEAKILKAIPELAEAGLKAPKKWRFEPARLKGEPVVAPTFVCYLIKAIVQPVTTY